MKHSLVLLFVTLSLRAQAPAPQPPNSQPAAKSGQTAADQPDAPRPELQPFTAPENPGVEPAPPIVEPSTSFTGSIDAGYRWISGVGGDIATYRSTINLGEGPKLFGADFLLRNPKRRLYDRIGVRVSSVGGEPYSSVQINARRERTYRSRLRPATSSTSNPGISSCGTAVSWSISCPGDISSLSSAMTEVRYSDRE
jgi:hypothetical protein